MSINVYSNPEVQRAYQTGYQAVDQWMVDDVQDPFVPMQDHATPEGAAIFWITFGGLINITLLFKACTSQLTVFNAPVLYLGFGLPATLALAYGVNMLCPNAPLPRQAAGHAMALLKSIQLTARRCLG